MERSNHAERDNALLRQLEQERRLYRDALLYECDYAYIVNVNENKFHDVYKGGFLEKYLFDASLPYDEVMERVVRRMNPVILHGMTEFHLTKHYIAAYEEGKRVVEVEYYAPNADAYKRKTLFLSKDENDVMYVFVVAHDITDRRRKELDTQAALTQLAEAAKKIGAGDLDTEINVDAPGLVGVLADVLSQTIIHLKSSIDKLNAQTTQDPMTGVKNKRAWLDARKRMDEKIQAETANFAVVVCDVNGLKRINDTIGHDAGDSLIIRACRHICRVFKHSPVYRIGGDEFTVILEGQDLANCDWLMEVFYETMEEQTKGAPGEPSVSIALGISHYQPEDMSVSEVFHRADIAMYQRKSEMKGNR